MNPFLLHILTMICTATPTAVGYNLVFGKGKIFHFGQIGFSLAAAYPYFLATTRADIPWPLALLIGIIAVAVLALIFSWMSLKLEADGLGVMTIAVHLALIAVVLNWQSVTRGALGIPGIARTPFPRSDILFTLAAIAVNIIWIAVISWFDRGKFGRALVAFAEAPHAASSLGIERRSVHLLAFLFAGFGALLSNILFHSYIGLMHPNDFAFPFMIFWVMIVVAGGPGNLLGAITATILLTILKEGLRFVPLSADILGPMRLILFGLILFAAVWWRRDTLFPQRRTI